MIKLTLKIFFSILFVIGLQASPFQLRRLTQETSVLSIFYCGFDGDSCGHSKTDDVNPAATIVILAFVNTQADGSVRMDEANFPQVPFNSWKASGKKVLISVGG